MPDYDFHQLSAYDLEILARDLLQAHWGVTIESFKAGKDGGIDLRYASGKNKTIVQVKHLARTGLAGLLRQLKAESAKVIRLQPNRYVVITSVPLSPANKDRVVTIIGARFLKPSDVIGRDEINNLLGQHSEIERKHYKLWLASRAVLDRVLNNAAITRSEFKAQQVHEEAKRYVQSGAYPKAMKMLNEERVVIVAGPPGVGKSTLANLLLYEHLERGYQSVLIQRDIDEGLSLLQRDVRQVFYFDDFMGATFLGERAAAMTGVSDRALLDFIAMVRADPSSRLILTTREHIYTQAMARSERLRNSPLDDFRVFLRMPNYSFAQKARILYNHLYFSDLPPEYQDELLRDGFYLRIIKHEKFNPRLIEWLSSFRRIHSVPAARYRDFVEELLKDPSEIWRHAYEQELTDAGRSMLLAIFSFGGKAAPVFLAPGFARLHRERANRYGFETRPEDFRSALREVAGSFIKPSGAHSVEVIDPSVLDLLNAVVRRAPDNAIDIIAAAINFDQVERIWSFAQAEKGGDLLDAIRREADRLANAVRPVMLEKRRIDLDQGSTAYRGPTFEHRLAVIIEVADKLHDTSVADLVAPLFSRLLDEWQSERPHIADAAAILRALNSAAAISADEIASMKVSIEAALLEEASTGCGSEELRELLSAMDIKNRADEKAFVAAREAFDSYRETYFSDELRDCHAREQFDGLVEDLLLFREELGVSVDLLIERVEEAKTRFEQDEDDYADHWADEGKERWREERASERNISEMFGSLNSDRE
jgi:DNA polymerase III delta prime subunit